MRFFLTSASPELELHRQVVRESALELGFEEISVRGAPLRKRLVCGLSASREPIWWWRWSMEGWRGSGSRDWRGRAPLLGQLLEKSSELDPEGLGKRLEEG